MGYSGWFILLEGRGTLKKKNGGIAGEAAVQALMFHLVLLSAPKEESFWIRLPEL
jgi:hypothetical protein